MALVPRQPEGAGPRAHRLPPHLSETDLAAGLTVRRASTRTEVRREMAPAFEADFMRAAILCWVCGLRFDLCGRKCAAQAPRRAFWVRSRGSGTTVRRDRAPGGGKTQLHASFACLLACLLVVDRCKRTCVCAKNVCVCALAPRTLRVCVRACVHVRAWVRVLAHAC